MPINVLGMIGVARPQTESTVHIVGGGLDGDYVSDFARVHEESGFDAILIGHSSSSADGFWSHSMQPFIQIKLKFCWLIDQVLALQHKRLAVSPHWIT